MFSRTTTRSTFASAKRVRTPGYTLQGRTQAYSSSALRRATFTLRNPVPMGVVTGPLMPSFVRASESSARCGQRCAFVLHDVDTDVLDIPVEGDARRLEDAAGGIRDLGAGAVAGYERHFVRH